MGAEEWLERKKLLRRQFEGFTPPHISSSCDELHSTWRGSDFTVHVYGKEPDAPWPIGTSPDKWFSKKEKKL